MSDATTPTVGTDEDELFDALTPEEDAALTVHLKTDDELEAERRVVVVDRAKELLIQCIQGKILVNPDTGQKVGLTAWMSYSRIYVRMVSAAGVDIVSISVSNETEMSRYQWEAYGTWQAERLGHTISEEWEYASNYGYLNRCEACMALGVIPKEGEPYGELLRIHCTDASTGGA